MIISMEELTKQEYSVSNAVIHERHPTYRQLNIDSRVCNGFIIIISGKCNFVFGGKTFELEEGGVAYIPYGSKHIFNILTEDFAMYVINFDIKIKGEIALFSDCPMKICDSAPFDAVDICESMSERISIFDNSLLNSGMISMFLYSLTPHNNVLRSKIGPAVAYIGEHLSETPDNEKLAKLCFLGRSQYYDIFKREMRMTPLEYRANLLIKKAEEIFDSGDATVGEVAELLGFESAAYFSRFFKKHTGTSPSELLIKKHR